MKAYSQDLREKVIQAIGQGKTRQEVVDVFGVSLSTVERYLRQKTIRTRTAEKDPRTACGERHTPK